MTDATVSSGTSRDKYVLGLWSALVVLTGIALLSPLGSPDRAMARSLSTVWVTILALLPVYALAPSRSKTTRRWRDWRSVWTVALVSFGIHAIVSIAGPLGGSVGAMFDTPLVSTPYFNLILSVWWAADVLHSWVHPDETKGVRLQRNALHVVLLVAFTVASVVQGTPTARLLGIALLLAVVYGWLRRRSRRTAVTGFTVAAAVVVAALLAIPTSREEVWSLSDCVNLVASGARPIADDRADRFLGKVARYTARCRGGSGAVAYRDTPWVDWSNYYGTGDSTSLALTWSPLGPLAPSGRGIDGALLDLEYQRIELIRYNLFDNAGTFEDYVLGRNGVGGGALRTWPQMRLPPTHPAFADVGGDGAQLCTGDLIRGRTTTGICNDIRNPAMGSSGMLFARNVEFEETFPRFGRTDMTRNRHGDRLGLLVPDPQVISRVLFTREQIDGIPVAVAVGIVRPEFADGAVAGDGQPEDPVGPGILIRKAVPTARAEDDGLLKDAHFGPDGLEGPERVSGRIRDFKKRGGGTTLGQQEGGGGESPERRPEKHEPLEQKSFRRFHRIAPFLFTAWS